MVNRVPEEQVTTVDIMDQLQNSLAKKMKKTGETKFTVEVGGDKFTYIAQKKIDAKPTLEQYFEDLDEHQKDYDKI